MAGLASAWAMARRRPKEYRRKVDAATAYAPIPGLYRKRMNTDFVTSEVTLDENSCSDSSAGATRLVGTVLKLEKKWLESAQNQRPLLIPSL